MAVSRSLGTEEEARCSERLPRPDGSCPSAWPLLGLDGSVAEEASLQNKSLSLDSLVSKEEKSVVIFNT